MNSKLISELYKEYLIRKTEIIAENGERDGFEIDGKMWWDFYAELIKNIIDKIKQAQVSLQDYHSFYKEFGYAPKLYVNSFVESGLERLNKAFLLLADGDVLPDRKIELICEDQNSEYYVKGIGTNFVTLFLTTIFPEKYAQWNSQTDDALKILDAYPKKDKGESKAKYYDKINKACIEISKIVNEPQLTHIDNLLFCISRGYVGKRELVEKLVEKEAKNVDIDSTTDAAGENKHLEIMYYLVMIGINKGFDVWVASNDRNKSYKGKNLSDICLPEIPAFADVATVAIAKYIDVIWFKKFTKQPMRFFEIEHTTSVYSGLLRLNDVRVDYPISKATIVIPADREDLFKKQIERRTFKSSQLAEVCDFMIYDNVKKWFDAAGIDSQFS